MTIYAEYTYEKLYLLKSVFSDHKSIDAVKQLHYTEHYYEYSHEKLGQMSIYINQSSRSRLENGPFFLGYKLC
jgi:hypothetical protein